MVSALLQHGPVRRARGWQCWRREGAAGLEHLELSLAARWGQDPAGNTLQGKARVFGHRGVQFVHLVQAGGGVRAAEGWI